MHALFSKQHLVIEFKTSSVFVHTEEPRLGQGVLDYCNRVEIAPSVKSRVSTGTRNALREGHINDNDV